MDWAIPYSWLRTVHIDAAFLGLVAFWLPLLVRKGSRTHVVCGWVFFGCASLTLVTAFVICGWRMIDPIGSLPPELRPPDEQTAEVVRRVRLIFPFLGALAFYTFGTLILAVRVVRSRDNTSILTGASTRLLVWSQLVVGLALIVYASVLWAQKPTEILASVPLGAGVAGVAAAWWDLRFIQKPQTSDMFWWYKHMEFMLRTGIAFHTAFAVFVLTPWLGKLGNGSWALAPWVVPAVVGLPAIWLWVRHYRRKFGELVPTAIVGEEMHART